MASKKKKIKKESLIQTRESMVEELCPPPIALLTMSCTDGYIGRKRGGPVRAVITEGHPCSSCANVLHAMGTQDVIPWPEARMIKAKGKCLDCDELHERWTINERYTDGLVVVLKHEDCTAWFVLQSGGLRLAVSPAICKTCKKIVQNWGRLKTTASRFRRSFAHGDYSNRSESPVELTMRISMCGSAGTGKSTIANFLHEKYGWPICPVGSRSVSKNMGFASPYDVDAAGKRAEFQRRLFEEKREWEEANKSFITDRTHFDNLVYSSMHGVADTVDLPAYLRAMCRYHIVFVLPVAQFQKLGDDPQRNPNKTYHVLYDSFLRGLIRDNFDPYNTRTGCSAVENLVPVEDAVQDGMHQPEVTYMLMPREKFVIDTIEAYGL